MYNFFELVHKRFIKLEHMHLDISYLKLTYDQFT